MAAGPPMNAAAVIRIVTNSVSKSAAGNPGASSGFSYQDIGTRKAEKEAGMKPALVVLPMLFFCCIQASAQGGAAPGPPVAFAPVTGGPLLSASGRFSSLTPPNQLGCGHDKITGRVVSPNLMMVKKIDCGRH